MPQRGLPRFTQHCPSPVTPDGFTGRVELFHNGPPGRSSETLIQNTIQQILSGNLFHSAFIQVEDHWKRRRLACNSGIPRTWRRKGRRLSDSTQGKCTRLDEAKGCHGDFFVVIVMTSTTWLKMYSSAATVLPKRACRSTIKNEKRENTAPDGRRRRWSTRFIQSLESISTVVDVGDFSYEIASRMYVLFRRDVYRPYS